MYVCQLRRKCTQSIINASALPTINRIEFCITSQERKFTHITLSVSSVHLISNLYAFVKECASSSNFFIRSLQLSDPLYKSPFSPIDKTNDSLKSTCRKFRHINPSVMF